MTEKIPAIDEQTLVLQITELTTKIELLFEQKLKASEKTTLLAQALADQVSKNVTQNAKTTEAMALLASIVAKICHLQAQDQKNPELILLTQSNDQAAQQVYDYIFNIYHTHAEGLARVSDPVAEAAPISKIMED